MSKNTPRVFHPAQEKLVDIIQKRVQNDDATFFRLIVAYYFSKVASMMRTSVLLPGHRSIPVNMYVINLSPSGSGKGHSVRLIEEHVINQFRTNFTRKTFPKAAEKHISKIGLRRATTRKSDPDQETVLAKQEFDSCGPLLFGFDSATTAAIKQMRTMLQMANAGSLNFEMDEIGSNLLGNTDALNAFLELFDVGQIKPKLVKHTRDNARGEDLNGPTPTNMMLFGTSAKLLNGTKIEEEFNEFIQIGYGRRCFFGYSRERQRPEDRDVHTMQKMLNDTGSMDYMAKLASTLGRLADPANLHVALKMTDDVEIAFLEYQLKCEERASRFSEFHETKRTEMEHRHFKTAKLAAAYAFIDASTYVDMDHWNYAMSLSEESGDAFQAMQQSDRPYTKLANYIASTHELMTQSDLVEDLPFYKGNESQKREMMNLAIAHGYKRGIYIKREISDGIEFFSGKAAPVTNLNEMLISWSDDIAKNYKPERAPWDKLTTLTDKPGLHWCNHAFRNGHRSDSDTLPGFNMIVVDIDGTVELDTAKHLLEDYKWLIYTTKRHSAREHRFRMIFPLSHELELDTSDYKGFMLNVFNWLPFEVDRACHDRPRKWLTCKGNQCYNDGQLLDALQFVPKTKAAEERKQVIATQGSLSALERWFLNNTHEGDRSNKLISYAGYLVKAGHDITSIQNNVMSLNSRFSDPLEEAEVLNTVILSANKYVNSRDKT